jgi:hypothetical protein
VFLRGPCQDIISKEQSQLSGSSVREAVKKMVSCKSAQLKMRLLRGDLLCAIWTV